MKGQGSLKKKFFKSKRPLIFSILTEEVLSILKVHSSIFRTQSSNDITWFRVEESNYLSNDCWSGRWWIRANRFWGISGIDDSKGFRQRHKIKYPENFQLVRRWENRFYFNQKFKKSCKRTRWNHWWILASINDRKGWHWQWWPRFWGRVLQHHH